MRYRAFIWLIFLGYAATALPVRAIECAELETVVFRLLKEHYVHRQFDDNLSQRVLDQTLKYVDPRKLIFTHSDVEALKDQFGRDVDLWILMQRCDFLDAIRALYYQRTEAIHPYVHAVIDSTMDFTIDERYQRSDKREYLDSTVALRDRWRRQLKYQVLQSRLTGLEDEVIRDKLQRHFTKTLTAPDRLTQDKLRDKFLQAFARALDPHTKYYPPANAADLRIALGESFFGIGATIESRRGSFFISQLNPGGPAFLGGQLKRGDQILAVTSASGETVEAFGKTLTELVHLIRGPKDSNVEITVHRRNRDATEVKKVLIIRDRIDPVAAAATKSIYQIYDTTSFKPSARIGVITLSSFYLDRTAQKKREPNYRSATRDVEKLIGELKKEGIDSLVLDLRDNGGGILSEAIGITGLFIPTGPVVQKQDAFGDVIVMPDKHKKVAFDGPLTVIIEPASASASEIVAGTLQDYRRALIVGSGKTFGKGTVQAVAAVDRKRADLGSFKLTNALYFLPSGRTPQLLGITPDVMIATGQEPPLTMSSLSFAIDTKTLPAVDYTHTNPEDTFQAALQARSEDRRSNSSQTEQELEDDGWISLLAKAHQPTPSSDLPEDQPDPILEETLRITHDRHRLLNQLPLTELSAEIAEESLAAQNP